MIRQTIATVCLSLAFNTAMAQVYKTVNPDGSVTYTDSAPSEAAKPMDVVPLQTYKPATAGAAAPTPPGTSAPAAKTDDSATDKGKKSASFAGYKSLEITSPSNDAAVWAADGNVSVTVKIDPPLQTDHGLVLQLDGRSVHGPANGTQFTLQNVDRGTHSLTVMVQDGAGSTVKQSTSVAFHLQRPSLLQPQQPRPAPRR